MSCTILLLVLVGADLVDAFFDLDAIMAILCFVTNKLTSFVVSLSLSISMTSFYSNQTISSLVIQIIDGCVPIVFDKLHQVEETYHILVHFPLHTCSCPGVAPSHSRWRVQTSEAMVAQSN